MGPGSSVPSEASEQEPAQREDILALAPVLEVGAPPCEVTTTPARDEASCYEVGPGSPVAVASAEPRYDGVGWTVDVGLTAEGGRAFRAAAAACFMLAQECPSGQLAVVVEGEVVSAPRVQGEDYGDELTISGAFTERQVRDLAAVLTA